MVMEWKSAGTGYASNSVISIGTLPTRAKIEYTRRTSTEEFPANDMPTPDPLPPPTFTPTLPLYPHYHHLVSV